MNQYCYSTLMTLSPTAIESSINKSRQQQHLRLLWPDYEVQDLLQKGINIWELARFTSVPLNIAKFNSLEEILSDPLSCKNWTHVAVHRVTQLGPQLNKVERYYVILSKRGLAVDELKSKFQRGTYIISALVAQLQKQICLWGVEAISGERHVIGPKHISRSSGMWRIQFESDKPLKSVLFYSTRREPKYGKGSTSGSQLPKDAKLQFCMNFKCFTSFLESRMKKEENMLENVPSFIPPRSRQIIFLQSESESKTKKETQPKVKNEQNSIHRFRSLEPLSKNKDIHVKILPNCAFLEINRIQDHDSRCINPVQIMQFIQKMQKFMHQSLQNKQISNFELKEIINNLTFSEIQKFCWSDIIKLLRQVSRQDLNHALQYLLSALIYLFHENNKQKTIQNWLQLNECLKLIEQKQSRQRFRKWIDKLMFQHCQEILKDSDQQQIEAIETHKDLIIKSIQWQLESSNHQSSKISDLLYLLMKVQGKKNIFDLYHSHQITNNSIMITPSIKQWQNRQNFYPKDDSDMLYQTEEFIQPIQYQQRSNFQTQKNENDHYAFSLTSSYVKLLKNAFISGKQFTINSQTFKFFIFRKKSKVEIFIERVESLSQGSSQTSFTSFQILIEMTVNNNKKFHKFGWSFISPSHSIGTTFNFDQLDQNPSLSLTISFKRDVFHESILNYLRVRYEQFLKMQNKCSDKLQQQNKKLLKRRSSLFLEKSLPDDVNFGNSIEDQCFMHGTCQKCQILTESTSLYKLSSLDLFKLMLSASFKEELNAFLVTVKFLILTPDEIINRQFWLSQIRVNHLNLKFLLTLVNKLRLDRDILQIISSLIQQKIKQSGPRQQKIKRKIRFIAKDQSRVGKCMWDQEEADYCEEYLQFLKNAQKSV